MAQLAYEHQLQTITWLNVQISNMVQHSEDAIHIFTVLSRVFSSLKPATQAIFRPARMEPVPVPAPVTLGTKVLTGERPAFIPFKVNP